ncbi:hypothetical protein BP5796_10359 [Coleophoma crateriformis]|uniref:DNA-(apurinic or apyrimidinic site) endonuclease 2 n=1 Tax=Coleophoma crateriformis TaxID=565419 RepID=A0A3D8QPZ9_9HELO|nr:hypothetical protein BP5796_10359 [Coleophoma crateriformis]
MLRVLKAMFDILEADIVVMQETKIQRKDLRDDMVLVPGWDVYFSLPKHKKGYSGVAIYTRSSVCAPIRAEEGITGILTPPNSTVSFYDLPEDKQIGGYPSITQLSDCSLDAVTLDSEGRCVILEFAAFVLIGVYSPANRDESRDEFRIGFLNALDARVRNLVAAGKRVFLTGDLNIIREEIDTANAEEQLRKHGMTGEEYVSTPARRLLNQLLVGGKVIGDRDEGRENPVLVDICRSFHATRKGMFTCWETKINARPGNFGSRIDYVLCSKDWEHWFCESNIQEGLIGSDHCPVYAIMKEKVEVHGKEVHIKDVMNPPGMFKDGVRLREWSTKDLLPMSARLIPEFDRRRNIRDMFSRKRSLKISESSASLPLEESQQSDAESIANRSSEASKGPSATEDHITPASLALPVAQAISTPSNSRHGAKRDSDSSETIRPVKRMKSGQASKSNTFTTGKGAAGKGQSSLIGYFKPKAAMTSPSSGAKLTEGFDGTVSENAPEVQQLDALAGPESPHSTKSSMATLGLSSVLAESKSVIDPIVSKESWSKLLGKRVVPRCEHNESCISFKTKKPGENCGRSFYMCARPLGPSGQKERNSQWRCGTFIWSSDWTNGDET